MNFENGTVAIVSGIRGNVMNGRTSRSSMRFAWIAIGVALGLSTAGCRAQQASPSSAARAPRAAAELRTDGPQCGGIDVHTKHIDLSFGCATCHPCGAVFGFDVPFTFPLGTTTAGGTLTRGATPGTTTCAVACHSPMGAPLKTVAWSAGPQDCTSCHLTSTFPPVHPAIANPNPTGADCLGCHTTGSHTTGTVTLVGHALTWMDQANAGFHAFEANRGLGKCQGCHAADLSGGRTGFSCAQCHDAALPVGVASWKVNCVMCHGGTGNQTGAPPKATWGNSADSIRIGAHATHVAASASSPAFGCDACHVKPADALALGHVDATPTAEMTWGGISIASGAAPAWDRATATCSNTYCHGKFPNGNAKAVVWTAVGTGQGACGTCHGLPPGGTHPSVGAALTGCASCHPATMTGTGALISPIAGGKHVDGVVQVAGGGHTASWMDAASPEFHAYSANAGIAACQGCHGVNLDGVGGSATTSCATCHGATWKTNCTLCHGGTANQTGAPPKGTWGFRTDAARIGAHTKHVTPGAISSAVACAACHVVPADALSPGHLNGSTASVTWGGIAAASGANPTWNRTTGSCAATYCHGAFPGGNPTNLPLWTKLDGTYAKCGSCHVTTPDSGPDIGGSSAHTFHRMTQPVLCSRCHTGFTATSTDPAQHVNGAKDVVFSYVYPDLANPDPAAACDFPGSYTVRISGWDCAGCHTYKDGWKNACCAIVPCY